MHTAGTTFFGKVIIDSTPDFDGSNIITTADRVYQLDIFDGSGSFATNEKITQGSSNGVFKSHTGIITIANSQPYIEGYTQISSPNFSSNTNSATISAITSNATHTSLYTTGLSGTIDTSDTIEAIIGRQLQINNVQQGNTVTGSFAVGESVYQSNTMGGVRTANGVVFAANSTHVQLRQIEGTFLTNTYVYGISSNAYANTSSVVNATNTYVTTTSINTLYVANVSPSFLPSSNITGANSGATANVSYIRVTLDT
jgi:hypothetical protein